ncbi:MAG: RNA-processing protein [Thermoprotei archaeon]|nr:MAG: RNA-processing protein [Thermoprotei archaeon]RLF25714.1 MAG: RNA-processing protein [Thermoprotei archaeon]
MIQSYKKLRVVFFIKCLQLRLEGKERLSTTFGGYIGGAITITVDKDRLGVIIGGKGEVKRRIEKALGVKLEIDSNTGEIKIIPEGERIDPLKLLKARDIIRAIAYGFSPDRAMKLLGEDTYLEVIDLKQYTSGRREDIVRVAGRIIGEGGKARKMIEELTGAEVSVYRHYVAIIGDYEQVRMARNAIEMLIQGRQHRTVYRYLFREKRELKRRRFELWGPSV